MTNREYYEDARPEMLAFLEQPPKKCMEFGCSSGGFSALLKEKYGCEVWGADIDLPSVGAAKERLDKVFHGDAYEVIRELPDHQFDYLICNDIIEHLYSPERFFEEVKRCLTPDAILICSLPNVRHWKTFNRYLFLKDWKYKQSGILDYTHLRFFTKKSMKRSIRNWGFEIEKIRGIRPTKSPFFYLFCLITLGFISDMRFLQYGFRAKLK
ncbi:MAG: class I SAM-dependent methyltransferase [Mariniphaga sp.]|nr:class I SAM-dependent methyltransferase [Mariniphaga sp.]MDD4227276.1 class I SAM-dependent methyltransferase [Mariniphaga sp.]